MDWIDLPESNFLRTGIKNYEHGKMYGMLIQFPWFVAPSWNRIMRAHSHVKNKISRLTDAWVAESLMGRHVPGVLCHEYLQLIRPNERRKRDLKVLKDQNVHDARWVKSVLERGYLRETISKSPPQFEHGVSINIFHFRKRQIDLDNLCVKFLIDGLVEVGLLSDDNHKQIRALQQIQLPAKMLVTPLSDPGEEMVMVEITECPDVAREGEIIMVGPDFP